MTPLPGALGGRDLVGWRLDDAAFAATWDSGEGSYRYGGRWSRTGTRVVYAALDPATAILEVAVHKGFRRLDTVPHVLTAFMIADPAGVHVVQPADVPNPSWLTPAAPGDGQLAFGEDRLARHAFVVVPSVVSRRSWNLVFAVPRAPSEYRMLSQERFGLDARLHPAVR